MDSQVLKRLNRRLEDLGRTPEGGPMFKWSHARDLKFPALVEKTSGGIVIPGGVYEWVPQMDVDMWMVAAWEVPPTYSEWVALFGPKVPYVCHGLYYATSLILPEGLEPNDAFTDQAVGYIKLKRNMIRSHRDLYRLQLDAIAKREADKEKEADDWLRDRVTAFYNTPGERGHHVSYGGI